LSWSQEDLEERSDVAKKTIADFERGARYPSDRTSEALQETLETNGVIFIPANGGGPGVRLKRAMPRFFRRSDVPDRNWIAFAFDYKDERHTAFVTYEALATLASAHPLKVFDHDQQRILLLGAELVDRKRLDAEGRLIIRPGDLKRRPKP